MKYVLRYYVALVLFLLPIFFLPVSTSPFGFGKNWFLGATALMGLVLWLVEIISGGKVIKVGKPLWLMIFITGWSLVGWLRMEPGAKMRTLTSLGGWGTVVALLFWVFLWLQVKEKGEDKRQLNWLTLGSMVAAVVAVVVFLLPASKMPISWPADNPFISITGSNWSLAGSVQSELVLFGSLLTLWIARLVRKTKAKGKLGYGKEAGAVAVLGLATLLAVYRLFKGAWVAMDWGSAWVIAVETLKNRPIFGMGIGNFSRAFNFYRPAFYNLTNYWSSAFGFSRSGFLQIWTELGLGGLVVMAVLIKTWLGKRKNMAQFWQLGVLVLMLALMPLNLFTIIMLAWLGVRIAEESVIVFDKEEKAEKEEVKMMGAEAGATDFYIHPATTVRIILTLVVVAIVGYGGYWWARTLIGEMYMRQSFVAAAKNAGAKTYDAQIKAVAANPWSADYRRLYSQTNLALAQNLLTKEDASGNDREQAGILIQQSVREAKAAVALENLNVTYWSNLATIYRALAGVVEGAPDWSFQAYQQAVALDPVNPLIRLDLGGLLFAAGRYEEADRVFEQVVTNKSDFANAWYNWAYTAKANNKLADAVTRLQQALVLVPVDSEDYKRADEELTAWKEELQKAIDQYNQAVAAQAASAEAAAGQAEQQLQTPEPLPTVGEEEQVNVPAEDLAPPEDAVPTVSTEEPVEEQTNEEVLPTE